MRGQRLAAFLAACLAAAGAAAATLPAKNLGFEDWDERGRPEGWRLQRSERFTVAQDCDGAREGRCALRIEGREPRGVTNDKFHPLMQPVAPGPAAGHQLQLSGWIRTERVEDGWAGLWLRAEVEGKVTALQNMVKEGPRGTSGWKRFSVAVEVPSNATLVAFGVLLSGQGSAWFDGLELAVDETVAIGRVVKTEAVVPPRPVPSRELIPDESLRLPEAQAARVRGEWREQSRAASQPIRSLTSEDFSDLQFLKPLLAGKRVVQLGESGHGVAEFNWMKVRLVKFLHREMGFDVVAFESSLSGCDVADARIGKSAPVDVMRDAIFQVWHSSETLGLFEYLDRARSSPRPLRLAGFDVQNSGRAAEEVSRGLIRMVDRVDPVLARRIERHEGRIGLGSPGPLTAATMRLDYIEAAERLQDERRALQSLEAARPVVVDLAIRELKSRARYVETLAGGDAPSIATSELRDEGMADNLDFVLDVLHPGKKVIVWAHNTHIARDTASATVQRGMGSWLASRRGAETYTIGLYMGWGIAARNDRVRYEIKPAADDSLEAILAAGGWRLAFTDLARAPWARERLEGREWGVSTVPIVPASAFDALIYVDAVTPPEYL